MARRRSRSRKQAKPTELVFAFGFIVVIGGGAIFAMLPGEALALGIGLLIIGVIAASAIFYYTIYLKEKARREALLQLSIDDIDSMTGIEFENYTEALLRKLGYRTQQTAITGDFGVDLIALKDHKKIAVQCKRYKRPLGLGAIQEVHAGMTHCGCDSALVITNSSFTKAAVQLARTTHCRLIDRAELAAIVAGKKSL